MVAGIGVAPVDLLTLRQQVGQVIVLAFRGQHEPAYLDRVLREGRAAGVILFRANAGSPAQLRRLTRELARSSAGSSLVAVDQEGGAIRTVGWAGPVPPQPDQDDPEASARSAALELRRVGVNVTLGPVADLGIGSALAGRAFAGPPAQVASATSRAVVGYRGTGVAAAAKHFPGLGRANGATTDDTSVTVPASRADLAIDLAPFRAAIAAGVPMIMASHARFPAFDGSHIASQSPAILQGVLRRQLGFTGVVVTDSLEAEAVARTGSLEHAARASLRAGCDLLLTTGPGSYRRVYAALLATARRDPVMRSRIREAAARVLRLKRRIGLRAPSVSKT